MRLYSSPAQESCWVFVSPLDRLPSQEAFVYPAIFTILSQLHLPQPLHYFSADTRALLKGLSHQFEFG